MSCSSVRACRSCLRRVGSAWAATCFPYGSLSPAIELIHNASVSPITRKSRIGCVLRRLSSSIRLEGEVFGIQSLRVAVGLWQLYFETGRWRGDLRADRMTGSGRDCEFASAPGSCLSMSGPGRSRAAVSEAREFTLPARSCRSRSPAEWQEQTWNRLGAAVRLWPPERRRGPRADVERCLRRLSALPPNQSFTGSRADNSHLPSAMAAQRLLS